ncbi:MAG: DUF421 domain-containing protein [Oscillospiraceae bacterium]|jgi:uncharacterized membrane protein YcaP (DUF421 family)|nr:DUF421 domain-containing protein [Oscillospiraceae bacterium]
MLITFLRAIILYLFIVICMRILGKRQLGELEASELAITIIIAELCTIPMQNNAIPLIHGILPALVIISVEFILTYFNMKSIRFRSFMWGKPSILVQNSEINQRELRKNRISIDELSEALRLQNVTDISLIKYAILETSGQISVILYSNQSPLTPEQMNISVDEQGLPVVVVSDGRILSHNLSIRNINKADLESKLRMLGHPPSKDIFLMTIDDNGNTYVVEKQLKERTRKGMEKR